MNRTVLGKPSAAGCLISARGLRKSFNRGQTKALDELDFEAAAGQMTAITGPSGSGKSTLLYALSGLISLDGGSVSIAGRVPSSPSQWTLIRRHHIGLVFQDDWLLPTLTCAQNVELPMIGAVRRPDERRQRVHELLQRVNAADLAQRMPMGLSGGERQRVAVARSLANRPDILLADEPTGELDTANAGNIMNLLTTLRERDGMTILIVTHDPGVADACDRQFVLRDGKGHYADGSGKGGAA